MRKAEYENSMEYSKDTKKVDPITLLHGIKLDHWMISSGEKGEGGGEIAKE